MTVTYFDIERDQKILEDLQGQLETLQTANTEINDLQKQLSPLLTEITELASPSHELGPEERTTKMLELQAKEHELRQMMAAIQTENGHQGIIKNRIEDLEPQIEEARKRLKQSKMQYGMTVKKFGAVDDCLQRLNKRAAKVDELFAELGSELEGLWADHANVKTRALAIGAKLNMGHGVALDPKHVDAILQAMMWPILSRSMHQGRPGPGIADKTLAMVLPASAREFLGEPVEADKPKMKVKKSNTGPGRAA
jgi:hypothetical protein